jgi:hypothetical protein
MGDQPIYSLSDSPAATKVLDNYQINSKLVWNCHQSLMKRAVHTMAQMMQMPEYIAAEGNEITD